VAELNESGVSAIKPVNVIATALHEVVLPSLVRPPVGPNDPPTEELVLWGLLNYAYSAIAHVRTVLDGLVALGDVGNQPTILIVGRHLFEWTMHASYMIQNFEEHRESSDLKGAWELFLTTDTGNRWIKRHGTKYWSPPVGVCDDVPGSLRVSHLVKAYKIHQVKTHGKDSVEDEYGYLSEHAHANGACFLSYREINGMELCFVESPVSHDFPGVIHACVVEWLLSIYHLLGLAREDNVRLAVAVILKSLVK
jgi:hypothetical protein